MAGRKYPSQWEPPVQDECINKKQPTWISPPPLKRQRTRHEDGYQVSASDRALALPTCLLQSHKSAENPTASRLRLPSRESQRYGRPFASSDHHTSPVKEDAFQVNRPLMASSSRKSVCRVCMKAMIVQYDPIITCPGCCTEFHDSCRKPPLIDGVDPYVVSISLYLSLLTRKGSVGGASNVLAARGSPHGASPHHVAFFQKVPHLSPRGHRRSRITLLYKTQAKDYLHPIN
jgi:hypothetical protein